jgi:peptidoglycan/LPS O-acetylase OafA/YrhL
VTWSLAIEEQFYLTLPLLVWLFTGRWLTRLVLAGICGAPILRVGLGLLWPHNWVARFVLMPGRADALLLGVLAAILLRDERWRERIRNSRHVFAIAIPVFLLGIAALAKWSPSVGSPAVQSVGYTWLALFYASVLLYALTRPASILSRALRLTWLGWLGGIAYGTYLLHQMTQGMLFGLVWRHEPFITGGYTLLTALSALLLTVALAKLSWRFFEHPLVRLGHHSVYKYAVGESFRHD